MSQILDILAGQVSTSLNGVTVLRTMVERRIQTLKQWAHLLCDYTRVNDPTRESTKVLAADVVIKRVTRLVTSGTVIAARNTMEAFSTSFQPNLVSRFPHAPFFVWSSLVCRMGFIVVLFL